MKTIVNRFIYAVAAITSLMLCSCADDFPNYFGELGDGEGTLSATVTFHPNNGVNLASTRTPGDAIKDINSLCVLIYSTDGNLLKKYDKSELENYKENKYTVQANDHLDGNEAEPDENTTAQASFDIPDLAYGYYKIYAVANLDLNQEKYKESIQTEEGLKKIQLDWNDNDIASNNQMFGFFTTSENSRATGFDADILFFTNKNLKIHSWLKRVVSKVTVAYNPSGLNQGVNIYIKNVTVRDIPSTCYLGQVNTPTEVKELQNHLSTPYNAPDFTKQSEAIPNSRFYYDGEGIIVDEEGQPITEWEKIPDAVKTQMEEKTYGLVLANGERDAIPKDSHLSTAQSLFFFENDQMKDEYKGNPLYNKHPERTKENEVRVPIRDENGNDFKDKVPLGTYIEVEAYYISTNPQQVGEGSIKYRFMLGKNAEDDYNAQRNYHFKVTLGFNGWANEPDWHIDYETPENDIDVPLVFRVSYLYNQKSELPIRIYGNCTKLEAEIIENNWAPYDPETADEVPPSGVSDTDPNPLYAFQWNSQAYKSNVYWQVDKENPAFGFLALHCIDDKTTVINEDYGSESNKKLIEYYRDNSEGYRGLTSEQLTIGKHDGPSSFDNYVVTPVYDENHKELANQKTVLLPVWTRAKSLIKDSGFSGNNPYEGFERKAVLSIHAEFNGGPLQGGTETTKTVTVLQVKRIVNPKGVWRDHGRTEPFDVTLLEAINANGMSDFQPFKSEGEWSAYIDHTNEAGFSLEKSPKNPDGTYMSANGDTIHGYTDTTIDFRINFDNSTQNAKSPCAIVKVYYHGNQCLHKILIRKGYDNPIKLGNYVWSSYSLYQATPTGETDEKSKREVFEAVLTKNPLMLGSMFRRGKLDQGIFVKNNMPSEGGIGPLMAPGQNFQFIVGKKENNGEWMKKTWNEIGFRDDVYTRDNTATDDNLGREQGSRSKNMGIFRTTGDNGEKTYYKVPSYEEWQDLTDAAEFGYGVVYGSAATGPKLKAEDAYGLIDPDNTGEFTDDRGMRGIIAYEKENGDQIFFPIGKYGTGRRTMFNIQTKPTETGTEPDPNYYGVLRYADVYNPLTSTNFNNNIYRPVPYNLPIASGNIYWIDIFKAGGGTLGNNCLGWDLNYFNFDFNAYTANNYQDACPIKLIIVQN